MYIICEILCSDIVSFYSAVFFIYTKLGRYCRVLHRLNIQGVNLILGFWFVFKPGFLWTNPSFYIIILFQDMVDLEPELTTMKQQRKPFMIVVGVLSHITSIMISLDDLVLFSNSLGQQLEHLDY